MLPRFRDPVTLCVVLNTSALSTFSLWFTGMLLFAVTNRVGFHCIETLPSNIWGTEINDKLFIILDLDSESAVYTKKNKYPLKLQEVIL